MIRALLQAWRERGSALPALPMPRPAPPTQRSLDELLPRLTRVRVIDGGMQDRRSAAAGALLDVWHDEAVAAFRQCLAIIEDEASFGRCECDGDQTLELYAGAELAAVIGLHHGNSIRWSAWSYDALLEDGTQLLRWMARFGAGGPLSEHQAQERDNEEVRQAAVRWIKAMPVCSVEPPARQLAPMLHALDEMYPETDHGILELLRWYGSGQGAWSGHPAYENVAADLLGAYTTGQLVNALARNPLSPAHREGAARFFCGHAFRYRRADVRRLPYTLRMLLLGHALRSPDADKRRRALAALSDSAG